jgi:hypothetical protein
MPKLLSGTHGNYAFLLEATKMARPWGTDKYLSNLANLKRLSPAPAKEIDITKLSVTPEAMGPTADAANKELVAEVKEWIEARKDFDKSFKKKKKAAN